MFARRISEGRLLTLYRVTRETDRVNSDAFQGNESQVFPSLFHEQVVLCCCEAL